MHYEIVFIIFGPRIMTMAIGLCTKISLAIPYRGHFLRVEEDHGAWNVEGNIFKGCSTVPATARNRKWGRGMVRVMTCRLVLLWEVTSGGLREKS